MARHDAIAGVAEPDLDEDVALRRIAEGVEAEVGEGFFRSLVASVCETLGVAYAFVSELDRERQAFRTLAVWGHGQRLENFELPLAGTPCEQVLRGEMSHHADHLQARFPADVGLRTWEAESYCGVPLLDASGTVLGHLAIFDTRPMVGPRGLTVLRIFAARACAELGRAREEARLRASEERYRDLYEAAPVGYLTIGADGTIHDLNAEAAKLLGYARDAIVGRQFLDLVAPAARAHARDRLGRAVAGEEIANEESEGLRADGTVLPITVSVRGVHGPSGRLERFRVTFVDISDRKRIEERLRASEALHRDLYQEAPVAYVTIGVDGRIQSLNEHTIKIFGYAREQSIGREFLDFIPEHARPAAMRLFARALSGETIDDEETEATRADGSTFFLRISARPVRGPGGAIEAFRVTFVDVSARKRVERALEESEVRYRDLYEEAPVAYWYVTRDGVITQANRAMATMFGHAREFFVGKPLFALYADTPHGKTKAATVRDRVRGGEDVRGEELECQHADGSTFWIRVSVKPQRDAAGGIAGWRVTAIDVTAQKRAEQVVRVTEYLEEEIRAVHNVEEMIGRSPALMAVVEKVRLVAGTDSSVLILGETGTGKELFARAVHSGSRRSKRPLIKVSCAALPSGLVESELFGHEKGAFTGANERRIGRFELADGGTIFLDEIGEVSPEVQVKLLRVLQEREIERVGGNKTIPVDVRVIAATNRDLKAAAAAGKFRSDLYYRLNVFPLEIPPLRERSDDIPLLVHYFVSRFAARVGRRIRRVPDEVMARIRAYPWPGNVRELEHVIERAVILSAGPDLDTVPDLEVHSTVPPPAIPAPAPEPVATPAAAALQDVERRHIIAVLKGAGWRIEGPSGAAARLDMNPSTLRSRMKKLGIQRSREEIADPS